MASVIESRPGGYAWTSKWLFNNMVRFGAVQTSTPTPVVTKPAPTTPPADDPFVVRYGTFTPLTISGNGDDVVSLPAGAASGLITATYSGGDWSNFILQLNDASNSMVELPVNEIGPYSGTTAYGMLSWQGDATSVQITADGPWTITVKPVAHAIGFNGYSSGTGDTVLRYWGPATTASLTHSGDGYIGVWEHAPADDNLLVNDIGSYNGRIPLMKGPSIIAIQTDGSWSIATS